MAPSTRSSNDQQGDDTPEPAVKTKTTPFKQSRRSRINPPSALMERPATLDGVFTDCSRNEPALAAYLGFRNKSHLRRFRFTYLVIEPLQLFIRIRQGSVIKDVRQVINGWDVNKASQQTLEDITLKLDQVPTTGSKGYNKQHKAQVVTVLADLLLYTYRSIPADLQAVDSNARQVRALKWIEGNFHVVIPPFDLHDVVEMPQLGPLQGESMLEATNRIVNLFQSVSFMCAKSRFGGAFGPKVTEPYADETIPDDFKPVWMREQEVQEPDRDDATSPLQIRTFTLIWDRARTTRYSEALHEHLTQYVDMNLLSMPEQCMSNSDPRAFNDGGQWRDEVRRQLDLVSLKLDFARIEMGSEGDSIVVYTEKLTKSWETLMSKVGEWQAENIDVKFALKPIEFDGYDYPFEYEGPPLAIANLVEVDQSGDIRFTTSDDNLQIGYDKLAGSAASQKFGWSKTEQSQGVAALRSNKQEREKQQQKMFSTTGGRRDTFMTPKDVKNEAPTEFLGHYSNIDTTKPAELERWQRLVIGSICENVQAKPAKKPLQLSVEEKSTLADLETDQFETTTSADLKEIRNQDGYFAIQAAFTGNLAQVGPLVDPCRRLLQMKTTGKHGVKGILDKSTCGVINSEFEFLDSQVNGAAFMLQRTLGFVPEPRPSENYLKEDVRKDQALVAGPRTFGGLVCDTMGLGKTPTAYLFLNVYGMWAYTNLEYHRPMLVLCPSGPVLDQWVQMGETKFPDLTLVTAYGEKAEGSPLSKSNWLSSEAMRLGPTAHRLWPPHLKYAWDPNDPRASKVLFISSYDTWHTRTLKTVRKPASTHSDLESEDTEQVESTWASVLSVVIADEGHRLRNPETKAHLSVSELFCRHIWLLTATPSINTMNDFLGEAKILWWSIDLAIQLDKEAEAYLHEVLVGGLRTIPEAAKHSSLLCRLAILHPAIIRAVVRNSSLNQMARYFPHIDNLISIRRSTASLLQCDEHGKTISLNSMMPSHTVKTLELDFRADERPEMQWQHRAAARSISQLLKDWIGKEDDDADVHGVSKKKRFPPVTGLFRHLCVGTSATRLSRLDQAMRAVGLSTNVENMGQFNSPDHDMKWLIQRLGRQGESMPVTRLDQIQYLTHGSPTLRGILTQIRHYRLSGSKSSKPTKLLITEDVPLVAFYYERVLNGLHVDTKVLGAWLTSEERKKMVDDFNDPDSSLIILIVMYSVSAQGVNLDKCCSVVLVASPAINVAHEVQAWGRVVRVSQQNHVTIIRLKVRNSHDEYKDSRAMEKVRAELATRASGKSMKDLLLRLLNNENSNIRKLQASSLGRRIRTDIENGSAKENKIVLGGDNEVTTVSEQPDLHTDMKDLLPAATPASTSPDNVTKTRSGRLVQKPTNMVQDYVEDPEDQEVFLEDGDEDYTIAGDAADAGSESLSEDNHEEDQLESEPEREFSTRHCANVSDGEDEQEAAETLMSTTIQTAKLELRHKTLKQQEQYDQEELYVRLIVLLDPNKIYEENDLEDEETLERALILLCQARFGAALPHLRITPHINYDVLPPTVARSIKNSLDLSSQDLQKLAKLFRSSKGRKIRHDTKSKTGKKPKSATQGRVTIKQARKDRKDGDTVKQARKDTKDSKAAKAKEIRGKRKAEEAEGEIAPASNRPHKKAKLPYTNMTGDPS